MIRTPITGRTLAVGRSPAVGRSTVTRDTLETANMHAKGYIRVDKNDSNAEYFDNPLSSLFGKTYFFIAKYEIKNVGGVAVSRADLTPWVNISQVNAIIACAAVGTGYHLPTIWEVQAVNRDIESVAANWTGGAVGSGMLKKGNVGIVDAGSYNGPDPDFGFGQNEKAKLVLSNGEEIWNWSGNIYEWIYGDGASGTIGSGFRSVAAWTEWNIDDLDEERIKLGPSSRLWDAASNGVGRYYGGVSTNAFRRGGYWGNTSYASVFTLLLAYSPTAADYYIGFRCAR